LASRVDVEKARASSPTQMLVSAMVPNDDDREGEEIDGLRVCVDFVLDHVRGDAGGVDKTLGTQKMFVARFLSDRMYESRGIFHQQHTVLGMSDWAIHLREKRLQHDFVPD
jgi:hypothetical protein